MIAVEGPRHGADHAANAGGLAGLLGDDHIFARRALPE